LLAGLLAADHGPFATATVPAAAAMSAQELRGFIDGLPLWQSAGSSTWRTAPISARGLDCIILGAMVGHRE
jgi:hypothetical protein